MLFKNVSNKDFKTESLLMLELINCLFKSSFLAPSDNTGEFPSDLMNFSNTESGL
ncbi:hypothetical protein DSECCO2_574800 [anaerobic digester metagenome]